MSDVPRNIERRVNSTAGTRGLDVKTIELEQSDDDGDVYKVVVNDEDKPDGENPAVFVPKPSGPNETMNMNIFGERLAESMSKIRNHIQGTTDETEKKLEETEQQLEERGYEGGDVEYGPGPQPNVEGIQGGYDDGDIRVESTTEADFSDAIEQAQQTNEDVSSSAESTSSTSSTATQQQESTMEDDTGEELGTTSPDDFFEQIADAAMDARQLEEKGHDRASEALLSEIYEDLDEYLSEGDT